MSKQSLEQVNQRLKTQSTGNTGKSSKRLVNNLGDRAQVLEAMLYGAGFTLTEAANVANMQARVERTVSREFIKYINKLAVQSPKSFWHVYEPNKIGVSAARLFNFSGDESKVYKSVMRMNLIFIPSKMLTPVPEKLRKPGPTGKYVKKRHKFPNKAISFEYGARLNIAPKKSKNLAFIRKNSTGSSIVFTPKTMHIDTKKQPTFGKLTGATQVFVETVAPKVSKSVYENQAARMSSGAKIAIRKKVTTRKKMPKSAIKAMGKDIARSLSK